LGIKNHKIPGFKILGLNFFGISAKVVKTEITKPRRMDLATMDNIQYGKPRLFSIILCKFFV